MAQVGDTLGRYTLLRRLPPSALGDLFLAATRAGGNFGSPVTLEVLHPELARNLAFVQSAIEESRAASALTHPNILVVHELTEDFGTFFLATEYVHGVSLRELVDRTPSGLDIAIALFVAIEVCRALTFLHNLKNARGEPAGRVHGDLEPAHVRLSIAGEVKMGTFSTGRIKARLAPKNGSAKRGAEGRPHEYAAPEVLRGAEPEERADLYSVGALLYEALTGRSPVAGLAPTEALARCEAKGIAPPSTQRRGLAVELDALVLRALDPNPVERWPSALAFRNALLGFAFSEHGCQQHFQQVGPELGRLVSALEAQPGAALQRPAVAGPLIAPSVAVPLRSHENSRTTPDDGPAVVVPKEIDPSQPDFDSTTSRSLAAPAALMRSDSPASSSQPGFQYLDFAESSERTGQTDAAVARLWRSVSGSGVALSMVHSEVEEEEARAARVSLIPNPVVGLEGVDNNLAATFPPDAPFPPEPITTASPPTPLAASLERLDLDDATASTVWAPRPPEASQSAAEETMRVPRRASDETLTDSQNTYRVPAKELDAVVSTRQAYAGVTSAPAPMRSTTSPPAHSPPAHSPPAYSPPAHSPPAYSPPAHSPPAHSPPAHSPPAHSPPAYSPPAHSPPAASPSSVPPPAFSPPATASGPVVSADRAGNLGSNGAPPEPAKGAPAANPFPSIPPTPFSTSNNGVPLVPGTPVSPGAHGAASGLVGWPQAVPGAESAVRVRPVPLLERSPRDLAWLGIGVLLFVVGVTLGALALPRFENPSLVINTIPPGASVSVNGRAFAETTPLIIEVLPDEHLDLTFELEGYEPMQRQLAGLARGERQTFTASLSRIVPELQISPVPAQVFLNDHEIGKNTTTLRLGMVDPDQPAVLRVQAPKFKPTEIRYSRGSRMPAQVKVRLKPE